MIDKGGRVTMCHLFDESDIFIQKERKTIMQKLDGFYSRPAVYGILFTAISLIFIFELVFGMPREFRGGVISSIDSLLVDNKYYKKQIVELREQIIEMRLRNPIEYWHGLRFSKNE